MSVFQSLESYFINLNTPKEIIRRILGVQIDLLQVIPKSRANVVVRYVYDDGSFSEPFPIAIEGIDYTNWSNDDDYIVNLIKEKLNLN